MKTKHFVHKTRGRLFLQCLVLAGLFPVITALAAYLESDAPKETGSETVRSHQPIPHEPVVPHFPPRQHTILGDLVRQLQIGNPQSYRGLTVFPLQLPSGGAAARIKTLDEALRENQIDLRECSRPQAGCMEVRNRANDPVFFMAGEIISGGKQNRIVKEDLLLPARSGYIEMAVYCGEKDRWNEPVKTYSTAPGLAQNSVRKMASKASPQREVWREIDNDLAASEVRSSTRNVGALFEAEHVRGDVQRCVTRIRRCWRPRTVGAIVCSGGRIISCDLFSDPSLFARLRDKLAWSWGLEAVASKERGLHRGPWPVPPGRQELHRFLDRMAQARQLHRPTPGVGQAYRLTGGVEGSGLNWNQRVLHAAAFTSTFRIQSR